MGEKTVGSNLDCAVGSIAENQHYYGPCSTVFAIIRPIKVLGVQERGCWKLGTAQLVLVFVDNDCIVVCSVEIVSVIKTALSFSFPTTSKPPDKNFIL